MDSLFIYRDEIEGKVGIGKLPNELQYILDYIQLMPNKTKPEKMLQERTLWIFNLLYWA